MDIKSSKHASVSSNHNNGNTEADISLGSLFLRERTKKNISLEEVAESTCIHITTLRAIEGGDRSRMPAEVFSRGFVKLYAEYLGLDIQDIMDRYNSEIVALGGYDSEHNELLSGSSFMGKAPFFTLPKIILLIFILILIALGCYYWWGGNNSPSSRQSRNVYFEKYYLEHNSSLYAAKKKISNANTAGGVVPSMH